MSGLGRILSPPVVSAALAVLFGACKTEPTRPAIPTISAQYAGTRYCAKWSCAYGDCYMRPDWDGGSCCLQWTLNQDEAVGKPGYCSQPKQLGCTGKYELDPGMDGGWMDDRWWCSTSCCASGSGDETKVRDPFTGAGGDNPNCPVANNYPCSYPPKP